MEIVKMFFSKFKLKDKVNGVKKKDLFVGKGKEGLKVFVNEEAFFIVIK